MSLKAKRKTVIRIFGSILILIGLILSIIYNLLLNIVPIQVTLIIAPWIFICTLLKLEFSLAVSNKKMIILIISIYTIGIYILTMVWNTLNFLNLFCITITILALLVCWHFSLSVYRKEKIYFIVGGATYIMFTFFYRIHLEFLFNIELMIEVIFVSFGMILILLIEYLLYRKGYLHYIQI